MQSDVTLDRRAQRRQVIQPHAPIVYGPAAIVLFSLWSRKSKWPWELFIVIKICYLMFADVQIIFFYCEKAIVSSHSENLLLVVFHTCSITLN